MKPSVDHKQKPAKDASSKACDEKSREAQFKLVWQATHRDFRGKSVDGTLSFISYAKYGGSLVSAKTISDEELAERLAEIRKAGGAA